MWFWVGSCMLELAKLHCASVFRLRVGIRRSQDMISVSAKQAVKNEIETGQRLYVCDTVVEMVDVAFPRG